MQMDEYELVKKIGKGTHGTTYLLRSFCEKREFVVCKSIGSKHRKNAEREISVLSKISHRRIVKLLDVVLCNSATYLILEYVNHGTVEDLIQHHTKKKTRPSLSLIWSFLAQVADALHYIHSKQIIHRDIKPANILVSQLRARNLDYFEFKLCDFSLSIVTSGPVYNKQTVGTPFYMAPEIVSKSAYREAVDVWSLGVVLYEMIALKKPFTGSNREELYGSIKRGKIEVSDLSSDISLNSIVLQCLEKEDKRPTAKQISKIEKVKLALAFHELKHRERRIEELEQKLAISNVANSQIEGQPERYVQDISIRK